MKANVETLSAPHGAPEPAKGTTPKPARHVAIATRHLIAQREKAVAIRDKANAEVKELDAALLALGWPVD